MLFNSTSAVDSLVKASCIYSPNISSSRSVSSWLQFQQKIFENLKHYMSSYAGAQYGKNVTFSLILESPKISEISSEHFSSDSLALNSFQVTSSWLKKQITDVIEGKKVIELACRTGGFLSFLEQHGAKVFGTTSQTDYGHQLNIEKEKIVFGKASDICRTNNQLEFFQSLNADLVFCTHLLDRARSDSSCSMKDQILDVLYNLGALNYIVPSLGGSGSLLSSNDFEYRVDLSNPFQNLRIYNQKRTSYYEVKQFKVFSSPHHLLPLAAHTTSNYQFSEERIPSKGVEDQIFGTCLKFRLISNAT